MLLLATTRVFDDCARQPAALAVEFVERQEQRLEGGVLEVGRGQPARLDSHHPCTVVVAHCRMKVLTTTSSVTASPVSDLQVQKEAARGAGWTAGPEQDSANSQAGPGRRVPERGALTSAHHAEHRELAQKTQNW